MTAPVEKIHAGWTIRLAHSCSPIIVSRWLACSIHCYACVCCVLVSVVLFNLLFAKLCIYTVTNVVVYYNVHNNIMSVVQTPRSYSIELLDPAPLTSAMRLIHIVQVCEQYTKHTHARAHTPHTPTYSMYIPIYITIK